MAVGSDMSPKAQRLSTWGMFAVAALLFVIGIFLVSRWAINEVYATSSNSGNDMGDVPVMLSALPFPEGPVTAYNSGNAAFSAGDYALAEERYRSVVGSASALGEHRECDLRVNLALSIVFQLPVDEDVSQLPENDKLASVARLVEASDFLCENGCALVVDEEVVSRARNAVQSGNLYASSDYYSDVDEPENPQGHDEDAQALEEEIEQALALLMEPPQPSDTPQDEPQPSTPPETQEEDSQEQQQEEEPEDGNDEEKQRQEQEKQQKKEELSERRSESYSTMQDELREWDEYGDFFGSNRGYSNKRW